LDDVRDRGVRVQPDVNALATRNANSVSVLVWNYHDDDLPAPATNVSLQIRGLPAGRPTLTEYRVDTDHSNAYTAWKKMGGPQSPTAAQYAELERAGKLQTIGAPTRAAVADGQAVVTLSLPRQGVSLVRLTW
jgi:xylan 1,4-beta-xylosidase